MKQETPLMTVRETAEFIHAHINTVRRWSNDGTIKSYRIGTRKDRRFKRKDLEKFLKGLKV